MTAVGHTAARYEFRAMYHTAFVSNFLNVKMYC